MPCRPGIRPRNRLGRQKQILNRQSPRQGRARTPSAPLYGLRSTVWISAAGLPAYPLPLTAGLQSSVFGLQSAPPALGRPARVCRPAPVFPCTLQKCNSTKSYLRLLFKRFPCQPPRQAPFAADARSPAKTSHLSACLRFTYGVSCAWEKTSGAASCTSLLLRETIPATGAIDAMH